MVTEQKLQTPIKILGSIKDTQFCLFFLRPPLGYELLVAGIHKPAASFPASVQEAFCFETGQGWASG